MSETPKQKAERLGVKLIPKGLDMIDPKREKAEEEKRQREAVKAMILESLNKTVAVCERCGRELSYIDVEKREPCGDSGCPFGMLTYDSK